MVFSAAAGLENSLTILKSSIVRLAAESMCVVMAAFLASLMCR
mgnify:CR=1 FL=1